MKKFLLSFLCFLMAIGGGYAEETVTVTFNFKELYGTSTVDAASKTVDGITISYAKNSCQNAPAFNKDGTLRLYYASGGNGGSATFTTDGTKKITKAVITASSTSYTPTVKYSVDGSNLVAGTWSSTTMTISGINASNTLKIQNANTSNTQLRITSVVLTVETITSGGGETPEPETPVAPNAPTLSAPCNFYYTMDVGITNIPDGAKVYYTTDGTDPSTSNGTEYTAPFEITKTTTVKAIAVNAVGSSDVATATYTCVAALPEIKFVGDASSFENSITVSVDTDNDAVAYYTLNGEQPTKKSTQYVESLTIKADATLKVVAYEEGEYVSPVVEQVFKMKNDGVQTNTATLVTNAANLALGDVVVIVAKDYDVALSTKQNDNNRGQIGVTKQENNVQLNANGNTDVQRLTLEKGTIDGTYAFNTGSGYLYAASSSKNYLRTQTTNNDNGSWEIDIAATGVATIKAKGEYENNWLRYNSSSNTNLFSCYGPNNTQKDVSLYKVIKDYVLNVTEAGWATLYFDYAVTIPDGVTCYVAYSASGESVQLTEVTGVLPANTAVIVQAEEGKYTFEGTEKTAAVKSIMAGTTKNEYVDKEAYVLGKVGKEVGLYKAEMNGGVFLNNANKAYLPATAVQSNAKALKFNFDTTAVENIKVETEGKKVIYDLSGRRVNDMTAPGLYIVNGKKVMVK